MRAAASRTFWTAGRSKPIRMAMMAITTSNSINVKPERLRAIRTSCGQGDGALETRTSARRCDVVPPDEVRSKSMFGRAGVGVKRIPREDGHGARVGRFG